MNKQKTIHPERVSNLAIASVLGGAAGFLLSRLTGRDSASVVLAETLRQNLQLAHMGPVLAVGAGAAAAIICAAVIPFVTITTLNHKRKEDSDEL